MKIIMYTAAFALLTIGTVQAQQKIQETKTVRTTVKSSLGNETVTKKVKTTKVTPTRLDPQDEGMVNQSLETGKPFIKKEVTYIYNDSDFSLRETDTGYDIIRMRENDMSEYGTMRKLAKGDVYMMRTSDGISVSYFDDNGNIVSEKYNDEDDSVTITTYQAQTTSADNKM